jgi:hypothetical protein
MSQRERLTRIANRWNIIEERIKDIQNIDLTVFVPAINELRYAGRKIVDCWMIQQDESMDEGTRQREIEQVLIVVEQYIENADHDLTDCMCVLLNFKLMEMVELYSITDLAKFHPDIFEVVERVRNVNDTIAESRRTRLRRNEIYDDLEKNHIPYIKLKYNAIKISEKTLETERIIRKRRKRARLIFDAVCLALGIFGALAVVEQFWPGWNDGLGVVATERDAAQ